MATKHLSASFDKGGLQIPHPEETAEGFWLNLIQKYLRKMNNGQHAKFTRIIEEVLSRAGRPDLIEHVSKIGPREWMKQVLKYTLSTLC